MIDITTMLICFILVVIIFSIAVGLILKFLGVKFVKKGKWMPHPLGREYREYDICSACGIGCKRREYEMQLGQERMTEHSYQYCPNCGAEMHK